VVEEEGEEEGEEEEVVVVVVVFVVVDGASWSSLVNSTRGMWWVVGEDGRTTS
jgi:hypothetical protein